MINYSPKQIAAALGGEVSGREVLCPAPITPRRIDRYRSGSITPRRMASSCTALPAMTLWHAGTTFSKLGIRWMPKPVSNPIARMSQRVAPSVSPPTNYIYELEDGTPYLRVRRSADKRFFQQHWTGSTWENGAPSGPKIPYRLPELKRPNTTRS